MSNQYDIFDNLNSYLDKSDDCDFPEDVDVGECSLSNLEEDEVAEKPTAAAGRQKKRGAKKASPVAAAEEVPPKKKSPPKRRSARQQRQLEEEELREEDDGEGSEGDVELLSVPSTSSIVSSTPSQSRGASSVNLVEDDLDEQIRNMQQQYDLIFNNETLTQQYRNEFSGLKRRFQTLLRQRRSARGKRNTFMNNLETLKDMFYNICVNHNLMTPAAPAGTLFSAPAATTSLNSRRAARNNRQQEPELINLVDSPALVIPGTINLDSDEEEPSSTSADKSANLSFDSENYEMLLKVKWQGKIEKFPHRKFQKFGGLIEQLAKRAGADPSRVILDVNERIISPEDTPDSIGYRISHFITGRVVEGNLADVFGVKSGATGPGKSSKPKTNAITLKVQSDRWKKPLEVQVEKDRRMMVVVIKCAEELKCRPADIKLSFDGEPVEMDATPLDLELEGGEVLDLRFVK